MLTNDTPIDSMEQEDTINSISSTILSKSLFIPKIQSWFGSKREDAEGYTEFGSISETATGRTLSTFSGVFSPVTLSMFSALLFLRVGFVVGNVGLLEALLQFTIAYGIILFTVASVCAVCTNGEVEGGGAYFMISRTLGPEFGGSIGTLFFFANIVSSALYIVGFAEGLINNFGPGGYFVGEEKMLIPGGGHWPLIYCSILNGLNLVVCLIGAGMFAKTSVFVLAVVTLCISSSFIGFIYRPSLNVSIPEENHLVQNATYHVFGAFTGLNWTTLKSNLYPSFGRDYTSHGELVTFSSVFGVLFSGVTGIMAGANMSGELKEPARSIPRGTLSAVLFTMSVYIALSIFTAATTSKFLLQNNYLFLMPINIWPPFVTIGILTATFFASLSNLIGSSRVIEALAKDNIYGPFLNFVKRGVWKSNPLAAVLTSWFLVQLMLLVGSLNTIAQINSILFLLSYLALNLACLGLELASAPNFRPSFRYFSWYTASLGLIGSLIMMFVINPFYASSSIGLCLLIILLLHLFSPARSASWGSISQALIFHQVRKYLLLLDPRKDHVKFWRPQILLMVGNPRSSCPLIDFVNDLKKSGLYVLGHVKTGCDFSQIGWDPTIHENSHWLSLVDHLKIKAFIEMTVAHSVRDGLHHLIRISGMGAMKPNTIIFGFYDNEQPKDFFADPKSPYWTSKFQSTVTHSVATFPLRKASDNKLITAVEYVQMISDVLKMERNVCLCRNFHNFDKTTLNRHGNYNYIDVWPTNFFDTSSNDAFDTTSLFMLQLACILTMVQNWKKLRIRVYLCDGDEANFNNLLQSLRITASIYKVEYEENVSKDEDDLKSYMKRMNDVIKGRSEWATIIFLYLAKPPADNNDEKIKQISNNYMDCLTELTNDLPPTVLVHGISPVTSTTL